MKQFFYCLGTLCILASTSLALPRFAFAGSICQVDNATGTLIVGEDPESPVENAPAPAFCTGAYGVAADHHYDVIGPNPLVSDYVDIDSSTQKITITSDSSELGLPPRVGATQKSEIIVSSSVVNGGAPGLGVEFNADEINPGSAHVIIFSDYTTSELVPEPSTGLLVGAALPMLFGIGRVAVRGRRAR